MGRKSISGQEVASTASLRAEHVHRRERILVWLGQGEQEEGIKETRWEPGKNQISDGLILFFFCTFKHDEMPVQGFKG